jgi:hypothetical protein
MGISFGTKHLVAAVMNTFSVFPKLLMEAILLGAIPVQAFLVIKPRHQEANLIIG